jgi:actin-related protein
LFPAVNFLRGSYFMHIRAVGGETPNTVNPSVVRTRRYLPGEEVMARKWEYRVTEPNLPRGAKSPVMDSQQMQEWLNRMDDYGWEFVGYGATHWRGYSVPQEWWIFRRPVQS